MKVLVVLTHPRRSSLTGQVADAVVEGLKAAGHEPELADLYREGFDPALPEADEPDWEREDKVYSPAVQSEMARIERNQGIVLVNPIWWWSFPAMTKGWIDRVFNKDWAYGAAELALKRALIVGLSASDAETYAKRGYDTAIETQQIVGIMNYCGVADASFHYLHGSTDGGERAKAIIAEARELGRHFADGL